MAIHSSDPETDRFVREQIARIDKTLAHLHDDHADRSAPTAKILIAELTETTFIVALGVALVFFIAGVVFARLAG